MDELTSITLNINKLKVNKKKLNRQEIIEAIFDFCAETLGEEPITFDLALECDGTIKLTNIKWRYEDVNA